MEPEAVSGRSGPGRWRSGWWMPTRPPGGQVIMRRAAGVIVAGELRFNALRAVLALVPYARTPKLHQQLLARLRERGSLDRDPLGAHSVERFCATGRWKGAVLLALPRRRVMAGGLFGALE